MMNATCAADAIDEAYDVCQVCGEQYCWRHLVYHRGEKKPPVCRECAFDLSGLRGARSPGRLGRRDYNRRRQELQDLLEQRRATERRAHELQPARPAAEAHTGDVPVLDDPLPPIESPSFDSLSLIDSAGRLEQSLPTPPAPPAPTPTSAGTGRVPGPSKPARSGRRPGIPAP